VEITGSPQRRMRRYALRCRPALSKSAFPLRISHHTVTDDLLCEIQSLPEASQYKTGLGRKAATLSDIGTKQTSISPLNMSAFWGKADISDRLPDVR
jgi:hypothetical protein